MNSILITLLLFSTIHCTIIKNKSKVYISSKDCDPKCQQIVARYFSNFESNVDKYQDDQQLLSQIKTILLKKIDHLVKNQSKKQFVKSAIQDGSLDPIIREKMLEFKKKIKNNQVVNISQEINDLKSMFQ